MIPWYAAEKVRALDEKLICSGVSGLELMERVGTGIAGFIVREISPKSVLICAGAGNNGGDGFVIARQLNKRNVRVTVILSHGAERSRGDAGVSLKKLLASGVTVLVSAEIDDEKLAWLCAEHEIIVDALLGTGASGSPRGETERLIDMINARRCGKGVLAVDMPSGIEGGGACIQAQWTCTAAARKLPCATGRGAAVCGRIMLVPLDERAEALLAPAEAYEAEASDIASMLPVRREDDHKGSRGGVLIVAGSERYRGAALLTARGALRAGAGLVVLASRESVLDALVPTLPEAIAEPLREPSDLKTVMERWRKRCSALVVGPGLDRDEFARRVSHMAAHWSGRSLWDGDGLYWLAHENLIPADFCVTPHEGEAAVLLGEKGISRDRFLTVHSLTDKGCGVLLKGYRSLVADGEAAPLIIPRGNRALSIPGSGDVLSGVCGAFLAAGLGRKQALALGAWCHGAAGERLGTEKGLDGILAREVADTVPIILKELRDL